jgi:hypothetical protein
MEAARTSETSVDNYFTRQHFPEDNSELHTRSRENLKSHKSIVVQIKIRLSCGTRIFLSAFTGVYHRFSFLWRRQCTGLWRWAALVSLQYQLSQLRRPRDLFLAHIITAYYIKINFTDLGRIALLSVCSSFIVRIIWPIYTKLDLNLASLGTTHTHAF